MKNFKCRFHLGSGAHFMHWRIENLKTGEVKFFNPSEFTFTFFGCFLRNQKTAAEKINRGETNKTVCAWIECDSVEVAVNNEPKIENVTQVCFNPKVAPFWRFDVEKEDGTIERINIDGTKHEALITSGSKVFIP